MDMLEGFLEQPVVPFLVAIACLPMILLGIYMVYVFFYRIPRQLQQRGEATGTPAPEANPLEALQRAKNYDTGDLPDLDLLLEAAAPARNPSGGVRVIPDVAQQVRLANGVIVQAKELMSILRDERDGRLLVQFSDTGYRSLADVADAKREFSRVMKELASVIMQEDDNPPLADAPKPSAPPAPAIPSVREVLETPPAPPPPTPKMTLPPAPRGEAVPGDLPSYRFDDNPANIQMGRMGIKKVDFTPPPATDIASAIEQFLQFKLAQTGMFAGREIHILPNPSGGVKIRVDEVFYDFVDEIKDAEVRAFVQAAIAEWQDRQG